MSYRLSRITTRTGDDGKTNLGTSERIAKDNVRIEAIGTLDELNSAVGMVLAHNPANQAVALSLKHIQQDLFDLGGELCPPYHLAVTSEKIIRLEKWIEEWNATLPPLQEFILPGGNITAATCHLARTICRRAERCIVTLHQEENLNLEILRYINRLSDLLFIAARIFARETTQEEPLWEHDKK